MNPKKIIISILSVLVLSGITFLVIHFYSYIFAKTVSGEVLRVEHVTSADGIIASRNTPNAQLFSFAIAIRDSSGEIHTSSSEDRQWAVVTPGQCAEARFFPYPPWKLDKARTYFGARLERLYECKGTQHSSAQAAAEPSPAASTSPSPIPSSSPAGTP